MLRNLQQSEVSEQRRMPVDGVNSDALTLVTGETVQLYYFSSGVLTTDAGQAAGVTVVGKLANRNILGDLGDVVGSYGDTSLSFTSTAFTNRKQFNAIDVEMAERDSENNLLSLTAKATAATSGFGNGDYCIDHRTGTLYGVKASTQVTLTSAAYSVNISVSGGGGGIASDVNIDQIAGVDVIADDGAYTAGTSTGIVAFGFADETTPDSVGEGDVGALRMTLDRKLHISSNFAEDTAHASGAYGTQVLGVRNDALAALATTDGDYSPLQVSAAGGLYTGISEVLGATISATNPVFAELTDGTAVVSAANPLNTQLSDGTTQADIIATINSLKIDTSSVAGTATNTNGGNRDAGTQTITLADDDPAVASLGIMDDWDNAASDGASISGDVAHDAADAGEPIKTGGYALSSQRAAVAAADRVDQAYSLYGELIQRSHTYGSQSDRSEEIDPLDEHYVEEELVDDTNLGAATVYYPSSTGRAMGNFNNVSIHYALTGGVTFTLEAKIDDSTDWVDITPAGYDLSTNASGNASYVDLSGIVDWGGLHVRTIRVKSVTSDATNGVQYHWKLVSL